MSFRPVNFAILTLVAGDVNAAAAILPPPAREDLQTAPTQCVTMLRIVGIPPNDVLYIRREPRIPEAHERFNQLAGIPASARWIEDLGITTGDWRRVCYLGIVGYARGRYLTRDIVLCRIPHSQMNTSVRLLEGLPKSRANNETSRHLCQQLALL